MKIIFTICSNNYLSQAKTLADSVLKHEPDYNVLIFLVDNLSDSIDYTFFLPHQIIPIEDIGINNLKKLWKKYNIIELNTCVKASVFKYLFSLYENLDYTFYFDPDIMLFNSIKSLEAEFIENDILLTPHIVSPIKLDNFMPSENTFLNYGIYNLGFIGVKKTTNTLSFLDWWEERLFKKGQIKVSDGIFVDQLYINLVPLFFDNVKIMKQLGFNAAPWNLHERENLTKNGTKYLINNSEKLVFYHFSSYNYKEPENISKYYNRYNFENRSDYKLIYSVYHHKLIENNIEKISQEKCYYTEKRDILINERIKNNKDSIGKIILKNILPPFILKLYQQILK